MSNNTLNLLFFASLGESLGTREETYQPATMPTTVSELVTQLSERGERWQQMLSDNSTRCAVNQTLAKTSNSLKPGDEVAFFPPVTGG